MRSFKEFVESIAASKKLKIIESFKADPDTWDYPSENMGKDINFLLDNYKDKFKPNLKLLESITDPKLKDREMNKLRYIILEAFETSPYKSEGGKFWSITKWIANNGKDPNRGFLGNANQRWTNIFKKLGYL